MAYYKIRLDQSVSRETLQKNGLPDILKHAKKFIEWAWEKWKKILNKLINWGEK